GAGRRRPPARRAHAPGATRRTRGQPALVGEDAPHLRRVALADPAPALALSRAAAPRVDQPVARRRARRAVGDALRASGRAGVVEPWWRGGAARSGSLASRGVGGGGRAGRAARS